MRFISAVVAILLLLATGCAGHHAPQKAEVRNPYIEKAELLNKNGVFALRQRHPARASRLFSAALQAATLADDAHWMALSGYNLGRAQAAAGDKAAAQLAYQMAIKQAEASADPVNLMRARLALALLGGEFGDGVALQSVAADFPIDIHLAAGQLAALRDRQDMAQHAYARVLALAGEDRAGLLYAARARLGLAGLARKSGDIYLAQSEVRTVLSLLHRAGAPLLTATALRFAAGLEKDSPRRRVLLQRAEDISRVLNETRKK
ncbi:MAG: hypothetical protein Q9M25_04235 [Mariprofundaceae bacterium]|nr:hypothetical protein [Mariprofundaceae bacterium]